TVCDLVTLDRVNALCASLGMRGTVHRGKMGGTENVTTPRDVGRLLDAIVRGAREERVAEGLGSTPELCRLALDVLRRQKLNTRMRWLVREGTGVAHKAGTGKGVFNDAGVVFRGEVPRFVLTAYTRGVPAELADGMPGFASAARLIGQLTRTCYDALT